MLGDVCYNMKENKDLYVLQQQLVSFLDPYGNKKQVEIVRLIPSENEDKVYIVYTDNIDKNDNNISLDIGILNEDENNLIVSLIDSDDEYQYALMLLKKQL